MTENELAVLILAEFKRQASNPDRVLYVGEDTEDLSMTPLDGDFDLIALAQCILEALPPLALNN
jgi:hypothetical protein